VALELTFENEMPEIKILKRQHADFREFFGNGRAYLKFQVGILEKKGIL